MQYNEKPNVGSLYRIQKLIFFCGLFFWISGIAVAQEISFTGDSVYISVRNHNYHVTKQNFNYSSAGDHTYDMRGDSITVTVIRNDGKMEKTVFVNKVNPEDTTQYQFQPVASSITPNVTLASFQPNGDFAIHIGTMRPDRFCKTKVEIFSRSREQYYLSQECYVFSCRGN